MSKDPRLKRFGLAGFNKSKRTPSHPTKSHVVLAKEKPKVIEKGTFGEDGWSISIGDVGDEDTKD